MSGAGLRGKMVSLSQKKEERKVNKIFVENECVSLLSTQSHFADINQISQTSGPE